MKDAQSQSAPGSSRTGGRGVPPMRKRKLAMGIVVASILLVALLGTWIVRLPMASTRTTITICGSTPPSTATHVPAGIITEFPLPLAHSFPSEITAGPDGNLWFTEGTNKIGRINSHGTITEFPLPIGGSAPSDITAGPDCNLWFTEFNGSKIGRISTHGTITEFPLPTARSIPSGITAGPDGNLWFTELTGNKIGCITSGT